MIVHIMLNTVFAGPYIDFILSSFDRSEHRFLVVGGTDPAELPLPAEFEVLDRVRAFRSPAATPAMLRFLARETSDADRIVLHGLFDKRTTAFLYLHPRRSRRSCWVIWGADLHIYRQLRSGLPLGAADRLVRGSVFRNLEFVVALAPGDVEVLDRAYGVSKRWTLGGYVNVVTAEHLDAQPPRARRAGEPVRVLLGNSASESNNHLEAIEWLSRFRDEPMEVLVPLSYGDQAYAQRVKEWGERLLGRTFVPLEEFLPPADYAALLGGVDVAIFNHQRQQALGNYIALAYLGVKIYTRVDGPSARYLAGDMGIPLFDVTSLAQIEFRQLDAIDPGERSTARLAAAAFYDPARLRSLWDRIFSARI